MTTGDGGGADMDSKEATVLIVDDEPVIRDLLSAELEERGYNCVTAPTGNKALTRLAKAKYDVVLLDLKLPGMSGMEVLKQIASTHRQAATIIITAVNDVEIAVEAIQSGATDYIVKPIDLDRVNDSIEKALAKMSAREKEAGNGDDDIDWAPRLDAIAFGVEARCRPLTKHLLAAIQRTVDIARSLDIPEDQIEQWAAARRRQITHKITTMESIVRKVERNPMAQIVVGKTTPHRCDLNTSESSN